MTKDKKKWYAVLVCITLIMLNVQTPQEVMAAGTLVSQTVADTTVIPDKYNTGCSGTLTVAELDTTNGSTVNGVLFTAGAGSTGTRRVLDFVYRNKEVSGTVYFENYDFSAYPLWSYNDNLVDRQIKLVFNNCKFSSVTVGRTPANISFEFNNCTMNSFSGSNATFNRCQFGNNYSDGLVPYCNIQVNDSFFKDMGSVATEGAVHTDGTQLYGIAGTDVHNITYSNCRFEIPPLKAQGSNAYINACIMFQLEFSSAHDVAFKDCIVNGGGYSIYARSVDYDKYTVNNVIFDGIKFGCANKWGIFYTDLNNSIKITDVSELDALYVGSVWKESGETHFSVTNDTNRERTLLIYTDKGQYTYTIPACPKGTVITEAMTYGDMPFDVDIVVPADCEYAVCFDSTISGCGKQIRFVNWNGALVYLPDSVADMLYAGTDDVLVSGKCGNDVTFTLTKSGVLTLSGTGNTYNYNSAKFPEWVDYRDYIKEVRVEEGIEGLGSMIFRHCTSIEKVTLPSTLKGIGQYAFGGCVSVDEFTLPASITSLGNSVFSGTPLSEIHYAGDNWSAVTLGTGNDNLVERLVIDKPSDTESEGDGNQGDGNEGEGTVSDGNLENGAGGTVSGGDTGAEGDQPEDDKSDSEESEDTEIEDDGSDSEESEDTDDDQSDEDESESEGSEGYQPESGNSKGPENNQPESIKPEGTKTENQTTGKTDNGSNVAGGAKTETVKTESSQSGSEESESAKAESQTTGKTEGGSNNDEGTKAENSQPEGGQSEQVEPESVETESQAQETPEDESNNAKNDGSDTLKDSGNKKTDDTGGMRVIFVVLGVVVLIGAVLLITRKKQTENEDA